MPCSDGRDDNPRAEVRELKREVDYLTRLLCNLGRNYSIDEIEFNQWYAEHERQDEIKENQEQEREKRQAAALERGKIIAAVRTRLRAQLTDEELEAVGLRRID